MNWFGLLGAVIGGLPVPAAALTAYVSNEKSNSISVLDLERMEVTHTIPVGQRPRGIGLSPNGSLLYICASDSNRIEDRGGPGAQRLP